MGKIPARGPITVRVVNANGFGITGALSGQTIKAVIRKEAGEAEDEVIQRVAATSKRTVKLKLPATLRRVLKRTGKLSLVLSARVKDPAGNTRTVKKKVTPRLKRR